MSSSKEILKNKKVYILIRWSWWSDVLTDESIMIRTVMILKFEEKIESIMIRFGKFEIIWFGAWILRMNLDDSPFLKKIWSMVWDIYKD